ncbi:MAG: hypothetical protein JNM72_11830 [Deltaproteobacteria bacterium]|nr:hypothetical protein [Deltaproteobacteria bacterium]
MRATPTELRLAALLALLSLLGLAAARAAADRALAVAAHRRAAQIAAQHGHPRER